MLEKDVGKILEATLSSGSDLRLKVYISLFCFLVAFSIHTLISFVQQMQSLQNIYEYLLDAESQMGPDKASDNVVNYPIDAGQIVPVAAGAGDTNICGGIIQLYWDNILGRCLDVNEHVRQSALKARISSAFLCLVVCIQVLFQITELVLPNSPTK